MSGMLLGVVVAVVGGAVLFTMEDVHEGRYECMTKPKLPHRFVPGKQRVDEFVTSNKISEEMRQNVGYSNVNSEYHHAPRKFDHDQKEDGYMQWWGGGCYDNYGQHAGQR